jgi:anti-sigma factor RsiW
MNCDEANRLVDLFLDRELAPDLRRQLERHLSTCSAYRSLPWEAEEFRIFFRKYAPRYTAPLSLRAKIMTMTDRPAAYCSFRWGRLAWIGTAAMALFLIIAASLLVLLPDKGLKFSREAVADYTSNELGNRSVLEVASADPAIVQTWFAKRLGFSPPRINLRSLGYALQGGRVARIGNRSVVALVYCGEANQVTIYCWPPTLDPVGYTEHKIGRYQVCTWGNSACNYILVAERDDPKIDAFVDPSRSSKQPDTGFY